MLYIKIQPQSFVIQKKIFKCFVLYMGMAAILFKGAEPFERISNTPWDGRPQVKSGENWPNDSRKRFLTPVFINYEKIANSYLYRNLKRISN